MSDLFNALFRLVQAYPLDSRLENITLCTELCDLTSFYWTVSQGKLQAISVSQPCSLKISGTISEWMELFYNPLQPVKGCQIQGDPHLFQILKENLQHLRQSYQSSLAKKIYMRSFLHQIQVITHNSIGPLPWTSTADLEGLRLQLRKAYQRLDRLQWTMNAQGNKP